MKKITYLLITLFIICTTGCSNDSNDTEESSTWAPEKLKVNAVIGWKGYYLLSGDNTEYSESPNTDITYIEILSSNTCKTSWSPNTSNYTYNKTGEKTAELSFSVIQSVAGNTRSFKYNIILEFTNKNSFNMTGTKYVTNSINSSFSTCRLFCTGIIK